MLQTRLVQKNEKGPHSIRNANMLGSHCLASNESFNVLDMLHVCVYVLEWKWRARMRDHADKPNLEPDRHHKLLRDSRKSKKAAPACLFVHLNSIKYFEFFQVFFPDKVIVELDSPKGRRLFTSV
jgi:hypothetical protein